MIEANELRKGNRVLTNGFEFTIENICDEGVNVDVYSAYTTDTYDKLEGIPLTPEILERCGFEKRNDRYISQRHLFTAISLLPVVQNKYLLDGGFGTQIKYLHQLQNLYFALAGEELNVRL